MTQKERTCTFSFLRHFFLRSFHSWPYELYILILHIERQGQSAKTSLKCTPFLCGSRVNAVGGDIYRNILNGLAFKQRLFASKGEKNNSGSQSDTPSTVGSVLAWSWRCVLPKNDAKTYQYGCLF